MADACVGHFHSATATRLPDLLIRRLMSILVLAIGLRYLWSGLT